MGTPVGLALLFGFFGVIAGGGAADEPFRGSGPVGAVLGGLLGAILGAVLGGTAAILQAIERSSQTGEPSERWLSPRAERIVTWAAILAVILLFILAVVFAYFGRGPV